jgi:hypothetical protein
MCMQNAKMNSNLLDILVNTLTLSVQYVLSKIEFDAIVIQYH